MTRRSLALVALSVVIAGACGAASTVPQAPTSTPAAARERTPWETELAKVAPDGKRTLDSALRLFAMAFGPIPGVDAPRAAVGTIDSASPAVRVVREHLDDLTPEQRAAVEGYLQPSADGKALDVPVAAAAQPAGRRVGIGATPDVAMAALVLDAPGRMTSVLTAGYPYTDFEREVVEEGQRVRAHAATYFGDIPDLQIRTTNAEGEPFVSFFNPMIGEGGVEHCQVILNRATANVDRFQTRRALSLDVVHCFQSWAMGSEAGFMGQVPAWAWEGPAEYIALEMWPPTEADALMWRVYLTTPESSLFGRSYDALGYYAQAFEAGVDLANAFRAVLTDVDNPERFALAGTTSNTFLDQWASELAREGWGAAWDFSGPGIPFPRDAAPAFGSIGVSTGSLEAFSQDAYGNRLFALQSSADIVRVEASGRARVGDGAVDTVVPGSAVFCTTEKGCGPCPDGKKPPIQPVRLAATAVLAVSGGTDGTNGTVSGHALEEFCKATPEPSRDDEFCKQYRAMIDWIKEHTSPDDAMTKPVALEIATRSYEMKPDAPPQLVADVDVFIRVYGGFAVVDEPYNVPIVGPDAQFLADAFMEMNDYCGIAFP